MTNKKSDFNSDFDSHFNSDYPERPPDATIAEPIWDLTCPLCWEKVTFSKGDIRGSRGGAPPMVTCWNKAGHTRNNHAPYNIPIPLWLRRLHPDLDEAIRDLIRSRPIPEKPKKKRQKRKKRSKVKGSSSRSANVAIVKDLIPAVLDFYGKREKEKADLNTTIVKGIIDTIKMEAEAQNRIRESFYSSDRSMNEWFEQYGKSIETERIEPSELADSVTPSIPEIVSELVAIIKQLKQPKGVYIGEKERAIVRKSVRSALREKGINI